MRSQQVYTAGALSKKIARRFALSNFVTMFSLFAVFVIVLNVWATVFSYWHIDARSAYQVEAFVDEHQSAENHSYGLSTSLLPIIYFETETGEYLNPHPVSQIVEADIDELLSRDLGEGDTTEIVNGQYYRVHRAAGDFSIQEGDRHYNTHDIILFRDISGDIAMQNELRLASALCLLLSLAIIVPMSYRMAQRSIVPINEAWRKQRQFAADASHKLKNPLAVAKANVEMIMRHPEHTVEEEQAGLEAVFHSTEKMNTVLSALLTMARADADGDEIVYEDVALSATLARVCEDVSQIARDRGIRLQTAIEPGTRIVGDPERIEELFTILVENALLYTGGGGSVHVGLSSAAKGKVVVEVRDTGIGMSADDISMAFQRFYRSGSARSMNPEGTGLGLPIAQWIVDRHNAVMDIASEPAQGTTIRITFDAR